MIISGMEIVYNEQLMAEVNEKMQVVDCSKDGRCSDCGQCCTNILPVNFQEINRIQRFIEKHKIQACTHFAPLANFGGDMICPFRDGKEKRCTIYPVRPAACKSFFCGNTREAILAARDKVYRNSSLEIDMRATFFGGPPVAEEYLKSQMR